MYVTLFFRLSMECVDRKPWKKIIVEKQFIFNRGTQRLITGQSSQLKRFVYECTVWKYFIQSVCTLEELFSCLSSSESLLKKSIYIYLCVSYVSITKYNMTSLRISGVLKDVL